ncbi:MAG: ABC transporter ATP-binding protein [Symploca sp. SIO1B1]|nr:ABC transporter ATP-binding protein [Symploca sp. SIO2D2]NER94943.1 ABC transporter ATP-binding protein [Symploca sp. SIO1B1]
MATFRDILNYYRPYHLPSILSITGASIFEIVDLVVPYAIGQILNILSGQALDKPLQNLVDGITTLIPSQDEQFLSLAVLLGIIFLVTVARTPVQPWIGGWWHQWAIPLQSRQRQSEKALKQILTLPVEFYNEHNPGRIAGRVIKGITNHTWTYPEVAGQLIPKLAKVLGIFVVIWFIDWRIAMLFLVSFVLILFFSIKHLKKLVAHEERLDRYIENTESRTSEIVTNIKTVKAFATEAEELERQQQRLNRELNVVLYRLHLGYVKLGTWQKMVVHICVFSILSLTLLATVQGKISLGHFVTTLTISTMAYSEMEPLNDLAELFARRYASMQRFHEFMEQPIGQDAAGIVLAPNEKATSYQFTGKVELNHVSFSYDPRYPVLQDIQLLIEPYQTVALVGRSGSGKSTLVKLLFRYFEPNQGRILIDGVDIRNLDITGYRKRLAIVHQEVDVFNGTLLDNITYGDRKASFEKVEEACRIARVDEMIEQLPQGYYTMVGERGMRLSGGQRQRLGIARALLVEPDVLVFDEATSSLDYESERSIQLAMQSIQGTRTTIIIAHRLSTVRDADKIVVLNQGRIAEVGNHAELLRQEGIYQRLHALQEK